MNRLATAAVGAAAGLAVTAAPASAAVDGWHDGGTAWAGVCVLRGDLYTVSGYADAWRWQAAYCGYQPQYVHVRLQTDGVTRYNAYRWLYPGPVNGYFGGYVYKYAHSTRLDVWLPNRGNATSHVTAYR